MGNFNPSGGKRFGGKGGGGGFGGRDSGRSGFSKRGGFGGNRDGEMFQAVCSDCGKSCEVPFRPTTGKPVYCNDCFGGKKNAGERRFPRKDFGDRGSSRSGFESNRGGNDTRGSDEIKKQLEAINIKLDKLIKTIDVLSSIKNSAPAQEKKEAVIAPVSQSKKVAEKKTPLSGASKKEVSKTAVKTPAKKVAVKKAVAKKKK